MLRILALAFVAGIACLVPTNSSSADDAPVSGQVVIGDDDRIQVVDTTIYPFSAIAYLELLDSDLEVLGTCTGTFIGPDTLLTAGHCLWDDITGDWLSDEIRVVPAKDGDFEPFGYEYASDWWVPDAYAESGDSEWDWGLIKLPNDFLTLDTGWMQIAVLDDEVLALPGFAPAIVGYPSDKPDGTMWGIAEEAFLSVETFTLYYDIDTAPGQSGSAIWSASEGPYLGLVVGIHVSGGLFDNAGTRIDQQLLDDLLNGCLVMNCLIDVAQPPPEPEPEPEPTPTPLPNLPYTTYAIAISRD